MKRKMLVLLAIVLFGIVGCGPKPYLKETRLSDGSLFIQWGDISAAGHCNSGASVKTEPQITEATKKSIYSVSSSSWDHCLDKKPNRNARNGHREERTETLTETFPIILGENKFVSLYGGGNPGWIHSFGAAAMDAAGMVGSAYTFGASMPKNKGTRINMNQEGGGASVGDVKSNSNSEINHSGNSSSCSSAKSESDSWSNSESEARSDSDVGIKIHN